MGRYQGFIRGANGTVTTVEVPGSYATTFAFEINNAGQIVRSFNDGTGTHGFLATPVNAKGDGRVYQVSFEAEDRIGGACTGTVTERLPGR